MLFQISPTWRAADALNFQFIWNEVHSFLMEISSPFRSNKVSTTIRKHSKAGTTTWNTSLESKHSLGRFEEVDYIRLHQKYFIMFANILNRNLIVVWRLVEGISSIYWFEIQSLLCWDIQIFNNTLARTTLKYKKLCIAKKKILTLLSLNPLFHLRFWVTTPLVRWKLKSHKYQKDYLLK